MARNVKDASSLLQIIAGNCPHDPATARIPFEIVPNYVEYCKDDALRGARIGIPRNAFKDSDDANVDEVELAGLARAITVLKNAGAEIIDSADYPSYKSFLKEAPSLRSIVTYSDWKADFEDYANTLTANPNGIKTVEDLISFTKSCPEEEYLSRDIVGFEGARDSLPRGDLKVEEAYQHVRNLGVEGGIKGAMDIHRLDALIMPSSVSTSVAIIAHAPVITVPLGFYPKGTKKVWNGRGNLVLQDENLP